MGIFSSVLNHKHPILEAAGSSVPANAYVTEAGDPYVTEAGDYYVTE